MPAKKTTAKRAADLEAEPNVETPAPEPAKLGPDRVIEPDDWDLVFYHAQPCTVHEFALAAKKPAAQCRVWLTEQAAAGRVTRNGDLQWHYS